MNRRLHDQVYLASIIVVVLSLEIRLKQINLIMIS